MQKLPWLPKVVVKLQGVSFDNRTFIKLLRSSDWVEYNNCMDPEKQWDIFLANITKALDSICPIKIKNLKVVDGRPEWLTNELLMEMRQRDKAFKKARRTNCQVDWQMAQRLRNSLGMNIKTAKQLLSKGS